MKKFYLNSFVLSIFFILSSSSYAYTPQQISEWTEQTLMTTLIAGHHEKISEAANVHRHYKYSAWRSMRTFLNLYLGDSVENNLREQQLILQPEPSLPAEIIGSEECGEASCWRVYQAFIVPQLHRKLEFTALVATANPAHSSPLIIHTLDIIISSY